MIRLLTWTGLANNTPLTPTFDIVSLYGKRLKIKHIKTQYYATDTTAFVEELSGDNFVVPQTTPKYHLTPFNSKINRGAILHSTNEIRLLINNIAEIFPQKTAATLVDVNVDNYVDLIISEKVFSVLVQISALAVSGAVNQNLVPRVTFTMMVEIL